MINDSTKWIAKFTGGALDGRTKEYDKGFPTHILKQAVKPGVMEDFSWHVYEGGQPLYDPKANTATVAYTLTKIERIEDDGSCDCVLCVARRSAKALHEERMATARAIAQGGGE